MKFIVLALMAVCGAANADDGLSNGGMPPGYPPSIQVEKVPYGSGEPSTGMPTGYSTGYAVGSGLYQVPGFLPYNPTGSKLDAVVIQIPCRNLNSQWYCRGYAITPALGRGEYILLQPSLVAK